MAKRRILTGLFVMALTLSGCSLNAAEPQETIVEAPAAAAVTEARTASEEAAEETQAFVSEMEGFAERIQEAVADKNMEELAVLITYPCVLETADQESIGIESRQSFMKLNPDLVFGDDLMTVIANVDTATLQMEKTGVVMGEGGPGITFARSDSGRFGIISITE